MPPEGREIAAFFGLNVKCCARFEGDFWATPRKMELTSGGGGCRRAESSLREGEAPAEPKEVVSGQWSAKM